ncbi:MAG TPA: citryl-CoA lyase [candidate division Zixibacteria bacterium]|nr:citryl-CoA lyase [candidate division Zixibacteria bacterium]
MAEESWKTSITDIGPGKIRVRGFDVPDLMENASFAEVVFLVLKGELPSEPEARMMEAILVSSVDHGASPPSVLATRTIMSAGNPLNASVAAGVMAIGDVHGGAIEQAAKHFQEWSAREGDISVNAGKLIDDMKAQGQRLPGFGHRLHTTDPRTLKLFEIAEKLNFSGKNIEFCKAVEKALEQKTRRRLPINVDGAIAAVISDMGFDWRLGKGFFMISRLPGLIAHAYEEKTTQRPMRKLGNTNYEYDGPAERKYPSK